MPVSEQTREFLENLYIIEDVESAANNAVSETADLMSSASAVRLSKAKMAAISALEDAANALSQAAAEAKEILDQEIDRAANLE